MKLFIIAFLMPLCLFSQIKKKKNETISIGDILIESLEKTKPIADINLLDSVLKNYRIFVTGENHTYIADNINMKMEMIKYLKSQAGVRNLIIELGFARGHLINTYINSDTTFLNLLSNTTNEKYLNFYKLLRTYNQTLPENERISVHGIDVERFPEDAPVLMSHIFSKNKQKVPSSISFFAECINSYSTYFLKRKIPDDGETNINYSIYQTSTFSNSKIIDTLIVDFEKAKSELENYLGSDFELFEKAMISLMQYRKYKKYDQMPHQYIYRENFMFNNLKNLLDKDSTSKYFGQFGRCHISQKELNEECNWWAFSSLAKKIKENSNYKILSMGIFYNTEMGDNYFSDPNTNEEVEKYKIMVSGEDYRMNKIIKTDSNLLQHYQYLIYAGNSKKDDAYNEEEYVYGDYVKAEYKKQWFDIGYGFMNYNLNNLNYTIPYTIPFAASFNNFSLFSVGFSNIKNRLYSSSRLYNLTKQNIENNDFKYKLNGYGFGLSLGYALINKKVLDLSVYGIMDFNQLYLNVYSDSLTGQQILNGFPDSKVVFRYKNPAFRPGVGADLRLNVLKWLSLYGRYDYFFDVSKQHWRTNNKVGDDKYNRNTPKQSLSAQMFTFGIGINIK